MKIILAALAVFAATSVLADAPPCVQDCPAQGLFDPGLVLAPSPNVTPAQIAAALAALNG